MARIKRRIVVEVRIDVEASNEKAWNDTIKSIANGSHMPHIDVAGGGPYGGYSVRSVNVARQTQLRRRYQIGRKKK